MSAGKTGPGRLGGGAANEPTEQWPPPLKPHPRWFWVLLGVWAAWVVVLLILYFATVFPHRKADDAQDAIRVSSPR